MLAALLPVARPLVLTRAPGARAAAPQELAGTREPSRHGARWSNPISTPRSRSRGRTGR